VLREPDYRRLFLGRIISLIADGMARVALAFAILDPTGSATDLGLVLAAHSIVITAPVLVGGVFADRISPRPAMLRADVARMIAGGLIAALLIAGVAEIWELAVLYAIDGAATAFFNPASNAIVPGHRLQEANALLNFSRWAAKVAGPALAGVLLALGSAGHRPRRRRCHLRGQRRCLVGVRAPGTRAVGAAVAFLPELRHGRREFSSRSWLVTVVLAAAVSNLIYLPAFQVLGPTVARESLGGSSS
jgi:MFS family permease